MMRTQMRRPGMDRGCGCGLRQFASEMTAEKARDKGAVLPGAEVPPKVSRCPRRPGVWHLVPVAEESIPPEVREMVLKRDGYRCVCCGLSVRGRRYSLGHRLRASQGGKAVPSNLITLLGLGGESHHGRIDSRRDERDEAKGYTCRSWQNPEEIPVMIFSEGGSGITVWLADDGTYKYEPPEGRDVA